MNAEVTALASFQEALFAWSDRQLFRIDGSGPPATGGLDLGFQVTEIPTPEGCTDWRGVCATDHGVYFHGKRGPYRLDGHSVTWLGAACKTFWDTYTECVAVVHDAINHEIVWFLRGTDTSVRIIYAYNVQGPDGQGQWTHDDTPFDINTACVAWQGTDTAGKLRLYQSGTTATSTTAYQTDSVIPDDENGTTYRGIVVVTPWLKLNTLQGWHRTRKAMILARFNADHGVTVEVGYPDTGGGYGTTWGTAHTWTAAEIAALGPDQLEVPLERQKAQAVRFRITETGTGVDGYTDSSGLELISIVIEAGFKPGVNKFLAASSHRK